MRGKHRGALLSAPEPRNIPAYAGKTYTASLNCCSNAEHPRVCGENSVRVLRINPYNGTSPRMRGKRVALILNLTLFRNIPAYAGKT